jgi:proline dehydrogenase
MPEEDGCLEKLKKDYRMLREKHSLPDFEKLNEDFSIEKISEYETDLLIKEVRKFMIERLSNYLKFTEEILNPVNGSSFIFSIINAMDQDNRKKLGEIYKKLAKNEVYSIETDISYSEKKEAEYIRETYVLWQGIKKEFLEIVEGIKKNWDNKAEPNSKGYFD